MFTSLELEVEGSKVWQGDHWRTDVHITGMIQLEVEGSNVWEGDHWRTNVYITGAGGGGK